jgi:hypothetical protein
MKRVRAAFVLLLCALAAPAFADDAGAHDLHAFDDAAQWTASASDQVSASLRRGEGADADALCLAFDFHGVSGYAAMRRTLPIDYPANYAFSFRVRGNGPDNALQFKVLDASGDNVWWVNRPDFVFPRDWSTQLYRKRQIDFAWGPIADKTLHRSESLEFTLYAAKGGRGEVCFDRLALTELPPAPTSWPAPRITASSSLRDAPAANAIDGKRETAWRSKRGREQQLTLDLGALRDFGGLVLHWSEAVFASRYQIQLSDDGKAWRTVRGVTQGNGGNDSLLLPESEARYLRIALHDGPGASYGLDEIEIKDRAFGASTNAFFAELAAHAPRGLYPRGFYSEQTYWTVIGEDGGRETGLMSEDGALEVARGGFSIEPFLIDETGRLTTWADVSIAHTLQDGYLPIPSVVWTDRELVLTTTAFATGAPTSPRMIASYALDNTSSRSRTITLALAVQPFQVNPSVQFLNTPGGVSPIHALDYADGVVTVDGKPRIFAGVTPDAFESSAFDAGMIGEHLLARGSAEQTNTRSVRDDSGLASGALLYRIELPPHASRTIALSIPFDPTKAAIPVPSGDELARLRMNEAAIWRAKLNDVGLRLPREAQPLADTLRTALAHILISRDGPALRPGTRSYARSWVRDGAMMSEGLLRLGRGDVAREYLQWYAPYQFDNGKVPCCVDARGSDPVPENDSHGELVHLVAEIHRYTGDRRLLESMWPHVDAATRYMDRLRASERTSANRSGPRAAFFGLMPASISHEGYSAKPMHSYWDDFWALTGYKDAVVIANALGKRDDASRLTHARDEFRTDLYESLRKAVTAHAIDYLPGCAELGDFDATSTTIALSPGGEQAALPQDLLHETFERYWRSFVTRRDSATWKDYTPYEWRTVGTFVRLGWRDRAQQAIAFFMQGRRPAEWNQWAEVVGRDARESRFVGDMPHGWVASDFIRSTLDLFAYERASDASIVLASGVPDAWLAGDGIAIERLRTPQGNLSFTLKREGTQVRLHIDGGDLRVPPGGFIYVPIDAHSRAQLNGRRLSASNGEFRIRQLPADLVIEP